MHLFLEGPVRTGKSTLIRQCITPWLSQMGGFSCQRMWENGSPCGYRLTAACEIALDAPFDSQAPGLFLWHREHGTEKYPQVFETLGIQLLEEAKNSSLILLDEIGGIELRVPVFRQKLYEILTGPVPCIGVLKLADKAGSMGRNSGFGEQLVRLNLQLRRDLNERFQGKILTFSPEKRETLQMEIRSFTEQIFSSSRSI